MLSVNFTPFPIITTPRLLLRKTTPEDVNELYYLRSSEVVMKDIDRPRPKSTEDILQLIEKIQNMIANNEGIEWAITLAGDHTFIGTISFHRLIKEHYRAEVGYLLHPAHHRKGIMSEALKAVVAYGFNNMGLHSIEAQVTPGNIASEKLLETHGFVKEGYFKENHFKNGKFIDTAIYSLLNKGK
jgi:[ribosomal protein S5]-alanine N-acetyltransferase